MPAVFNEHNIKSGLKDKRKLSAFLDSLVQLHLEDIKKTRLNYIFCDDDYLLVINKQYLDHDTLTDIITFDLSEGTTLVGEIYVSVDRVKENAKQFNVSYIDELHRVIFHGALHLCGFKDKKPEDEREMRTQEDKCLLNYKKKL
ncbi:MAG: rRNA maturation RNase YbeY [Taibaiella sp.]|nr:rRNA maturation RNase YbeY [Taibaiella sp.]